MPRPGGPRRSVSRGSSSKLNEKVRQQMDEDPAWQHFTRDGRWLCPYCLTAVRSPQQGKAALMRAVDRHLSNRCAQYGSGSGAYRTSEEVAAKVAFEDIAHLAVSDPAWQVFDHEGYWYSPSTLGRVEAVRIQNRRFDGFTIQRMAAHMANCAAFKQGHLHDAATVQRARDNGIRVGKLATNIRRLMTHTIWRYKDHDDRWICPYCLDSVGSVVVPVISDWPQRTEAMAAHLLNECNSFSPKSQVMRREDEVAQAAGMSPPSGVQSVQQPSQPTLPIATPAPDNPSGYHRIATPLRGIEDLSDTARQELLNPEQGQEPRIASPLPGSGPYQSGPIATPLPEEGSSSGGAPYVGRIATPVTGVPGGGHRSFDEDGLPLRDPTPTEGLRSLGASVTPPGGSPLVPPPEAGGGKGHDASGKHAVEESPLFNQMGDQAGDDGDDPFSWMEERDRHDDSKSVESLGHSTELIRARDVQQKMLKDAPEIPGYTFATRYEAATEVSGDFYEFIQLADGRIGFAQGDVSGHGMQAGMIMTMAKKVLSIFARQGNSPADVLAAVNDALAEDLGGKMFVTIAYAILDPDERTITWARAGHSPPVRFNTHSGEYTEINPGGMVVGMKSGPLFRQSIQEEIVQLRSGDVFIVYTDGITETMNRQGEEYDAERLRELIVTHGADEELERLLDRILDSIRSFRGSTPADDDITLLGLTVD